MNAKKQVLVNLASMFFKLAQPKTVSFDFSAVWTVNLVNMECDMKLAYENVCDTATTSDTDTNGNKNNL